jgi:hypothetical protein
MTFIVRTHDNRREAQVDAFEPFDRGERKVAAISFRLKGQEEICLNFDRDSALSLAGFLRRAAGRGEGE